MTQKNQKPADKAPEAQAAASETEGKDLAQAVEAFEVKYADAIKSKIRAGLTRQQAIDCQRAQVEHDAAQKKPAAK